MSAPKIQIKPAFVEFAGALGPILIGLHNVIRIQPCRTDPENRTFIWPRGHQGTTCVVTLPYAQVMAAVAEALAAGGGQ